MRRFLTLTAILLAGTAYADYPATILADSPLVFYQTLETSGSFLSDSTGNGWNGTLFNVPTSTQPGVPGPFTGCSFGVHFFATNGWGTISGNGGSGGAQTAFHVDTTGDFSVEVWAKADTTSPARFQAMVAKAAFFGGFETWEWALEQTNVNNVIWEIYEGNGNPLAHAASISSMSTSVFHHYVGTVTLNGTPTIKLYVDGVQEDSSTTFAGSMTDGTQEVQLAKYDVEAPPLHHEVFWFGTLSNVAIYNTVLNATQVLDHYNAGVGQCLGGSRHRVYEMQ